MTKNMKRRNFLKISAAGASVAALSHYLGPLLFAKQMDDRPEVDRCTGKKIAGVPTSCLGCGAACGMMAYVRDGQLMRLSGNPAHPVNRGTLCLVGQAAVYTLYDPERVQKPKVRIGSRGQGRWKEISWDEATKMLSERIKGLRGRDLVLETRGGSAELASREFARRTGGTVVSHGHVVSPNREAALMETLGVRYDYPDIARTNYILNFGANPFESGPFGIGPVVAISSLKGGRAMPKLVSFDPRLSATAGRSDEWFPIVPGTDALVALAMANVIMTEGLYDKGFIERHTNTSVAQLISHLSQFTPVGAERVSGIAAADIRRIAVEYASADKAVLLTGGGVSKHADGTMNERAVRLLPVITGKIGRPGCNIIPAKALAGKDSPDAKELTPDMLHRDIQEGRKVGIYMVHGCDPVYGSPEASKMARALADESRIPFIVAMDTHVTDTGLFADMVLPVTTFLEEYGLETAPGPGGETIVNYRRPVVPPMGESKPYAEALSLIASKAASPLSFSDSEDYTGQLAGRIDGLAAAGGEEMLASKGFFVSARNSGMQPGKLAVTIGKSLPGFSQPSKYKDMKLEDLILVTYAPSGYKEDFTENNLLLKEIFHQNKAFINSKTGEQLGLKTWDKAVFSTPAGKIEATVMLTPGMEPKTVAMARGCGHQGYGKIEGAEKFESRDPFTTVIWWDGDGKGTNPNLLTPFSIDRESGGQGWMMTKVTVEKAEKA
ncbi:MAG: molybdopterin-dependent oxidoreductase [Nitrospirota bacterium]